MPPERTAAARSRKRLRIGLRRGAQQRQPVDPGRLAGGQPHRGHPAQREPGDVRPFGADLVEEGDQVVHQVVERVRPRRRRRVAVPAGVVGDDAEPLGQRRHLRVPHAPGGAEGVGEDDDRRVGRPVHGVRDVDGAHSVPSVRRRWSARTASTWAAASPTSGAPPRAARRGRGPAGRRGRRPADGRSPGPAARRRPRRRARRPRRGSASGPRRSRGRAAPCPPAATAAAIRAGSTRRPARLSASQEAAEPTVVSSVGQGRPLAVPGAGRALVLLLHRGEQRGHQPGRPARAGPGGDRRDRVVLVRHRRRAAPARADLRDLGDLGLREQDDVHRHGGDHAGRRRPAHRPGRRSAAGRCATGPGCRRQAQLRGQRGCAARSPIRCSPASVPAAPPYWTGSDATTSASRSRAPSSPLSQPAALSPNVVGSACCISVRPMTTSSRCRSASRAAAAAAAARSASIAAIALRASSIEGGVEDVLAGRAHVDGDGVPLPHGVLQHPHQRRHRVAGVGGLRHDGRQVQAGRVRAGGGHRVGGRRRHEAQPGGGAGERGLHLEQGAEPGRRRRRRRPLPRARRCRRRVRSRAGSRSRARSYRSAPAVAAHTAKNTVSRSPWRRMSRR